MKMQMSDAEIVRNYREAKDKAAQVKILAELNACPVQTIKDILIAGGVDWRELPRVRRKGKEEKPAEITEKETEFGQAVASEKEPVPTSNETPGSKSDKELVPTREDGTTAKTAGGVPPKGGRSSARNGEVDATNEEEIILLALYALRQRTEDQMAYAEEEHAARMKRYNSLLSQVEALMKKRETDEILKKREGVKK